MPTDPAPRPLLTLATLGLAAYGLYAILSGLVDLFGAGRLEIWANALSIAFGLILTLAAAFVRVLVPGGLALAIGAMLGLQALALHDATHYPGGVPAARHALRAAVAALLVALAYVGSRHGREHPRP